MTVIPLPHNEGVPKGTLAERFATKFAVNAESGCWIWTAAKSTSGYGKIGLGPADAGSDYAHRVSYQLHVGPIPDGLVIDHLCRNRLCVNPAHLEVVTHQTNLTRGEGWSGRNARKTHCPQGHELSEVNIYQRPDGRQLRECLTCRQNRHNARKSA